MATFNWRVGNGAFGLAADWINATTGDNPALSPPGSADTANFGATGGSISGTGAVATLNFSAGPAWTMAGQVSAGRINIDDATTIASGGRLTLTGTLVVISNAANSSGSLTVNAGGTLNTTVAPQTANYILEVGGTSSSTGASGTLTVQGANAVADTNGNGASVGIVGTGLLSVLAGGTVQLGTTDPNLLASLSIGRAGHGTVSVSGAGSQLLLAGSMYAGRAAGSTGTLQVAAGGSVTETAVGSGNGSTFGSGGTINGSFTTGGTGTLNVLAGGTATFADSLNFGSNGATGIGNVTGGLLKVGGTLRVGTGTTATGGHGTLAITAGGVVQDTAAADSSSYHVSVGASAGTSGQITLAGAGSLLDGGQNGISIGNAGSGTLAVSGGAKVTAKSPNSQLIAAFSGGRTAGSASSVTVTGAGSSVVANGYAYFGRAGTASLLVDQGASFTGGSAATGDGLGPNAAFGLAIGDGTPVPDPNGTGANDFGGTANAQVKSGSLLHSLSGLRVGYRGTAGTLLVDSGSQALADGQVLAGSGTDRTGGAGTITVQGGSLLQSGGRHVLATAGVVLGNDAGTTGTIAVSGALSLLDANGDRLTVGGSGAGTLNIGAGGKARSGAAYADAEAALSVAAKAGASGTINIAGIGAELVANGLAVIGGNDNGSGLAAGGTGAVGVTSGGLLQTGAMQILAGSSLSVGAGSTALISGTLTDAGSLASTGALTVTGAVTGSGTLALAGGLADLGALASKTVTFTTASAALRVHALSGASSITGMQFGDTIDLAGITGATLAGNTVTAAGGSLTLNAAPGGYIYKLYGDSNGGTEVLLNPTAPPPNAVSYTDAVTNTSSTASGNDYTGPVDYLQREYIYNGTNAVAIAANVPNAFLKGGPNGDALVAKGGNNVLDGGGGSNFLIGGDGSDGGRDTFFVDARGGVITWSTIVNFHQGDQATIFGFHPGLSTRPLTPSDGAPGYTGATIHSEIGGPGSGVTASMTFAGLDANTVSHLTYSAGTLPGNIDYLLIQYL